MLCSVCHTVWLVFILSPLQPAICRRCTGHMAASLVLALTDIMKRACRNMMLLHLKGVARMYVEAAIPGVAY